MRAEIRVRGVVQGVGFRPFVYSAARAHELRGCVRNLGSCVEIIAEGPSENIEEFISDLRQGPPLARVDEVEIHTGEELGETDFHIVESGYGGKGGFIPPDMGMCSECVADINHHPRYTNYWATSCVNCGPRFTLIESLPYDRDTISMIDFPMCPACRAEYQDPSDRRHHAQTIACPSCGPNLALIDPNGVPLDVDPVEGAARFLLDGQIISLKGVGGFHVACILPQAQELRVRLGRSQQPFALMAPLDIVEEIAEVGTEEKNLLEKLERPIVLLRKRDDKWGVAPGLHTIGIMLPYTGLHHLLFRHIREPLIMTSANLPSEPMVKENEEALGRLRGIADYHLIHDRRIVNRCDDSVIRPYSTGPRLIRMSRGFAPVSLPLEGPGETLLAVGPELMSTAALYTQGKCYVSQHVGNVTNPLALDYLEDTIRRLIGLTGAQPTMVVHDLHPLFASTGLARRLAEEFRAQLVGVQHHRAHVAPIGEAVGIAVDGVGYGDDGSAWGGEVFAMGERVGSLSTSLMPGGDRAVRYPARMVAGMLHGYISTDELEEVLSDLWFPHGDAERKAVIHSLERGVNVARTSSAGRFLDAVAVLTGVCRERTYEGEPAMKLESLARNGDPRAVDLAIEFKMENGRKVLDTGELLLSIIEARSRPADIAAAAQDALASGLARIAIDAAGVRGLNCVGISGGVAYNEAIVEMVKKVCVAEGFKFVVCDIVPCGDGGVSYGQIVEAIRRLKEDKK